MGGFNQTLAANPATQDNNDFLSTNAEAKTVGDDGFGGLAKNDGWPAQGGGQSAQTLQTSQTPSAAISRNLLESAGSFSTGGQTLPGDTGNRRGDDAGWLGVPTKPAQPLAPRQRDQQLPESGLLTSLVEAPRQSKPINPFDPPPIEAAKKGGILEMMSGYPQWREGYLRNFDKGQQEFLKMTEPKTSSLANYANNVQAGTQDHGQVSNPNGLREIGNDGASLERTRQENVLQRKQMEENANNGWNGRENPVGNGQSAQAKPINTKPAFDPVVGDKTTPPAYKSGYLSKQPGVWEGFNKAADKLPNAGDNQKFTYGQIFAAEGGIAKDPESSASSGILQSTLDGARKRVPGLESAKTPSDLTLDQRAAVMKDYFDQSLRTVGGSKALDHLPTPETAAAFGDAIYRHGAGDGARVIQRAIRSVDPGRVEADGKMGPETFKAFNQLASDPERRNDLLDSLAKARGVLARGHEAERMNHFRFPLTR